MSAVLPEFVASLDDLAHELSRPCDKVLTLGPFRILGDDQELESLVDLRGADTQSVSQRPVSGFCLFEDLEGFLVTSLVTEGNPGQVGEEPHSQLVIGQLEGRGCSLQVLESGGAVAHIPVEVADRHQRIGDTLHVPFELEVGTGRQLVVQGFVETSQRAVGPPPIVEGPGPPEGVAGGPRQVQRLVGHLDRFVRVVLIEGGAQLVQGGQPLAVVHGRHQLARAWWPGCPSVENRQLTSTT